MGVVQNSINQLFTLAAVGAGISPQVKEAAEIRGLKKDLGNIENAQQGSKVMNQAFLQADPNKLSDKKLKGRQVIAQQASGLAARKLQKSSRLFELTGNPEYLDTDMKQRANIMNARDVIKESDSIIQERAMKRLEEQAIAKLQQSERFKNHLQDVKTLKEGIGDISGFSEAAQKSVHRQLLQDPKVRAIVAEDIALEKEGGKR